MTHLRRHAARLRHSRRLRYRLARSMVAMLPVAFLLYAAVVR